MAAVNCVVEASLGVWLLFVMNHKADKEAKVTVGDLAKYVGRTDVENFFLIGKANKSCVELEHIYLNKRQRKSAEQLLLMSQPDEMIRLRCGAAAWEAPLSQSG